MDRACKENIYYNYLVGSPAFYYNSGKLHLNCFILPHSVLTQTQEKQSQTKYTIKKNARPGTKETMVNFFSSSGLITLQCITASALRLGETMGKAGLGRDICSEESGDSS